MFSTNTLVIILAVCGFMGIYCISEKHWEGVIACIIGIFLCGLALYFKLLGGVL